MGSDKVSIKVQMAEKAVSVSTISPCTIFVDGIEIGSLNAFGNAQLLVTLAKGILN